MNVFYAHYVVHIDNIKMAISPDQGPDHLGQKF